MIATALSHNDVVMTTIVKVEYKQLYLGLLNLLNDKVYISKRVSGRSSSSGWLQRNMQNRSCPSPVLRRVNSTEIVVLHDRGNLVGTFASL